MSKLKQKEPLRIGIAGLGTVGMGTVQLLQNNATAISARAGRPIQVVAVSSRSRGKDRGMDLSAYQWHEDALALVADPQVDVVVELIGGSDGIAKELCEAALKAGKPVVTANKALIAHHGTSLAQLAESKEVALAFEAAVAGGIPILHALRTGLSANQFSRMQGILNGTCNYILTTMRDEGKDFADVLKDAQALGYAEADPSFDVDGVDAAHKLAILTSLAFGTAPDFANIQIEGIRNITARDMEYAKELGYVIKLLGIAERTPQGITQRVHPCFVPLFASIAKVDGVFNAVNVQGDAVGSMMFEGRGAGAMPTASSVVSDLIDIARGCGDLPFTIPAAELSRPAPAPSDGLISSYYIRLEVVDKAGVLAEITSIFRDHHISMRSFVQHSSAPNSQVEIALTTHEAQHSAMEAALKRIAELESVAGKPQRIRIES